MPELRADWLTGRSVIVAENRAGRPNEFAAGGRESFATGERCDRAEPPVAKETRPPFRPPPGCPFCPGRESQTPPAVYQQTDANGEWRIRVIPNKYPAVTLTAEQPRGTPPLAAPPEAMVAEFPCAELAFALPVDSATAGEAQLAESLRDSELPVSERLPYAALPAFGAHEVIVESRRHHLRSSALSPAELRDVLATYAARLAHWRRDERLRWAFIFKNQGPQAGASLGHLHSQLVALPAVPPSAAAELRRAEQAYRDVGECAYCRLIERERAADERMVLDRDGFVAFCPSASLQPYETWLFPGEHEPALEQLSAERLDRLAGVLHALVARLESLVPEANYNLLVRTAPWLAGVEPWCHWRIELLPRVASLAGMELGAGIHINPLAPEHAAQHLRPPAE